VNDTSFKVGEFPWNYSNTLLHRCLLWFEVATGYFVGNNGFRVILQHWRLLQKSQRWLASFLKFMRRGRRAASGTDCHYRADHCCSRTLISTVLWSTGLEMFFNSFLRTGLFLCKQDSSGIKCLPSILLSVGTRTASTLIGGDKQKTMDDLDLTSLYWLFGKGYFQTTHQMQVKTRKQFKLKNVMFGSFYVY